MKNWNTANIGIPSAMKRRIELHQTPQTVKAAIQLAKMTSIWKVGRAQKVLTQHVDIIWNELSITAMRFWNTANTGIRRAMKWGLGLHQNLLIRPRNNCQWQPKKQGLSVSQLFPSSPCWSSQLGPSYVRTYPPWSKNNVYSSKNNLHGWW